jgi:hypothetical protein
MHLWRLILMWVMVAAIPLQGIAASSMLFCGPGSHHAGQAQVQAPGVADEGSGSHAHGKASHVKQDVADSKQAKADGLPDATHKCGVCASCCHSLAIAQLPREISFAVPPHTGWAEPALLIHSPPAQVPEKPPRV